MSGAPSDPSGLHRGTLGVGAIVFLVLAAVAPLTGMIVVAGIGIATGVGGATPLMYVAATVVFLLFAVGYARMAREVINAGGFYVYVVRGLGRTAGLMAAGVALVGYNCFVIGAIGTSGFFTGAIVEDLIGVHLPWWVWSVLSAALAWLLTRSGIDFSTKVLAVSLTLEVAIIVALDVAVLARHGYSLRALDPALVTGGSVGLGLLFAATAFVGFEATGLFGEEARDPRRTIPRATYVALVVLGALGAITTWAIVSAIGPDVAGGVAREHLAAGDLVFVVSEQELGHWPTTAMKALLLVSLFAALLALHNAATRYLFALGRVHVLPPFLSRTRSATGAPVLASTVQLGLATAVALLFAIVGADPATTLVPAFVGVGTLGILTLQALAATAVVVHFRRRRSPDLLATLVLPGLGGLGLWVATVLAFVNFPAMAGSEDPTIARLPWLIPAAIVITGIAAVLLRRTRPGVWAALDQDLDRAESLPGYGAIASRLGVEL
ncbi:APC family permease [Tsukamurella sputi]|nr:APC family permease [Tsukamurella sputi]